MIKPIRLGVRVKTFMGVALSGVTIPVVSVDKYTDGSYRPPYSYETPIYVKWDDGTKGWMDKRYIIREN